ncbi:MAG TPA: heavy-metal-associated domain-containing protein [Gammaproteobacteria bacterium]|nr:heavy-metal-associated domain-containing protein [Gammaproteobacteria bacterium]
MEERFKVKNVKCGGCVAAIETGLEGLPGVQSVKVVIEGGQVTVAGENLDRTLLSAKLSELGYPEV